MIRIITRKSPLARRQAEHVAQALQRVAPTKTITILETTTDGDEQLSRSLAKIGGKGLFVKKLEQALLNHEADLAVHSLKDMPAELPDGLILGAILKRDDPRDVLVGKTLAGLTPTSRVGTSSLRRQAQLLSRVPCQPTFLRGNITTRLDKLRQHDYDAIILAACGLQRLGMASLITEHLPLEHFVPAIGQGALCVECRHQDPELLSLIEKLNDPETAACVHAERALLKPLHASCHSPIAGFAYPKDNAMVLHGQVATPDGKILLEAIETGKHPIALGEKVAKRLIEQGALDILEQHS